MICYFQRLGIDGCSEGFLDRAHFIPKQRLRIAGLDVEAQWDERVWAYMCRRHHHLYDHGFLRLERGQLPSAVEAFAAEHDLLWSLERDYGAVAA